MDRSQKCFMILPSNDDVIQEKQIQLLATTACVQVIPKIVVFHPLLLHLRNQNSYRVIKQRFSITLLDSEDENTENCSYKICLFSLLPSFCRFCLHFLFLIIPLLIVLIVAPISRFTVI